MASLEPALLTHAGRTGDGGTGRTTRPNGSAAPVIDGDHKVRVALVDDAESVRRLVRLHLELDGRFEVVGEGSDGVEAIGLVESTRPDLLIIDRDMPRMTGIEAVPRVKDVSPHTAVVLYTSDVDAFTYQAAMAAGAGGVLPKDRAGDDLIDALADILLRFWSDDLKNPGVKVGPVSSASALAWIENSCDVLRVLRDHPEVVDRPVDEQVFEAFERLLDVWRDIAGAGPVFVWAARVKPGEVGALLEAFAAMDRVDDEQLAALGVRKADPAGAAFFQALTGTIVDAVRRYDETSELARRLGAQWGR